MSEELTGTIEAMGKGMATISGVDYVVKDYVDKYLARHKLGDVVDFSRGKGETWKDTEVWYLLKIALHKDGVSGGGKKPGEKKKKAPVEKNFDGVFRKSDGVNALIAVGEKNSLYCLTPLMAEKIKEATPGQKVLFTIDQNSFLVRFALGEVLSPEEIAKLPPTTLPVKTGDQIKKENITNTPVAATGESKGESPAPVKESPPEPQEPGRICETCTSPHPPVSIPTAARIHIDCSINLGNYESLKIGIDGEAGDRAALIVYLINTARQFGRNNELIKELIEGYIRRVLE